MKTAAEPDYNNESNDLTDRGCISGRYDPEWA